MGKGKLESFTISATIIIFRGTPVQPQRRSEHKEVTEHSTPSTATNLCSAKRKRPLARNGGGGGEKEIERKTEIKEER